MEPGSGAWSARVWGRCPGLIREGTRRQQGSSRLTAEVWTPQQGWAGGQAREVGCPAESRAWRSCAIHRRDSGLTMEEPEGREMAWGEGVGPEAEGKGTGRSLWGLDGGRSPRAGRDGSPPQLRPWLERGSWVRSHPLRGYGLPAPTPLHRLWRQTSTGRSPGSPVLSPGPAAAPSQLISGDQPRGRPPVQWGPKAPRL